MAKALTLCALSLLACLLAGCHTGICTQNQSSIPCAQFYGTSTDAPITLSDLTITGVGAPDDAPLYESGTQLSTVYLPLRQTDTSTSFRLHFSQFDVTDEDTGERVEVHDFDDIITFNYTATPYFDGEDCGAMYRFHITGVDHTGFLVEKVVIMDPFITNTDAVRIAIYIRTASQDPDSGDSQPEDSDTTEGGEA